MIDWNKKLGFIRPAISLAIAWIVVAAFVFIYMRNGLIDLAVSVATCIAIVGVVYSTHRWRGKQ